MTDFTISIAGSVVSVRSYYDSSREYCKAYLCQGMPDFSVEITQEDLDLEREKCSRTDQAEGVPVREMVERQLEVTAIQRKIAQLLFARNTIVFHGSAVAVDEEGYLFTAVSGTGKSTHTRLWREAFGQRAVMVNDDKPFLRIIDTGVMVCGSPWNGKHRLGSNICVPLKAICLLERGERNEISQITAGEALPVLLQQSSRPQNGKHLPKFLELMDRITQNVTFYRLKCNMEPEAAKISYEAMSKR